jgi:hypothetical protein
MKKLKPIISFFILLVVFLAVATPVLAQYGLNETGVAAGLVQKGGEPPSITSIIATVINVLLGLVGVGFFVLLTYAGVIWLTAQGDAKKVDEAKTTMKNAVIGLIVVLAAYAISTFVVSQLVNPIVSPVTPAGTPG